MATLDQSKYKLTPERQANVLRFFRQQFTARPQAVTGVDLNDKTAIVTGSNTGIGLETARQLLDLGLSKLILAVRNLDKGADAKADLLSKGRHSSTATTTIEVWKLDYSDYDSILEFTTRAQKELDQLNIVILNAGIGPIHRTFNSKTRHDELIQVNYLSTALLAILLLSVLRKSRTSSTGTTAGTPGRLTILSSEVAAWTKFSEVTASETPPSSILAALDSKEEEIDMMDRMMVSKLLGQFFVAKLASLVPVSTSGVIINAVSPGTVYGTEFDREREGSFSWAIIKTIKRVLANSPAVGARMITDAVVRVDGERTHGEFLSFQEVVP